MASNALVQQTITDYLADHDSEHPETTLDPYHPNNTSYYQQHNMFKRLIVAQSSKMKALHVKVAKGVMKAIKNKDIALELNLEPTTISNIKHRDDVKELINLSTTTRCHAGRWTHEHINNTKTAVGDVYV